MSVKEEKEARHAKGRMGDVYGGMGRGRGERKGSAQGTSRMGDGDGGLGMLLFIQATDTNGHSPSLFLLSFPPMPISFHRRR